MLTHDVDECREALGQPMPDNVRAGLTGELRKLETLQAALAGEFEKSTLHSLRAKLRYARIRLSQARDAKKKKILEEELRGWKVKSLVRRDDEPPHPFFQWSASTCQFTCRRSA